MYAILFSRFIENQKREQEVLTREQRILGMRIAKKEGLFKTEEAIKEGECYKDIFTALREEAGEERSVKLIGDGVPVWALQFSYFVSGLLYDTKETLAQIVIKANNPELKYRFALNVYGISDDTKEALAQTLIETNHSGWAYHFANFIPGISDNTRDKLRAVGKN